MEKYIKYSISNNTLNLHVNRKQLNNFVGLSPLRINLTLETEKNNSEEEENNEGENNEGENNEEEYNQKEYNEEELHNLKIKILKEGLREQIKIKTLLNLIKSIE